MVEATDPINRVPNFVPIDKTTWDSIKEKLPNTLFEKNRARFFRLFKEKVQVSD